MLGITPDLTTLGKYLAGGFTFGAFGGRRDLMAAFDATTGGRLGHAGTFNNNVVSMAAGVATLTEVLTPDVLATTNARGERLRSTLNDVFGRHGLPMCVTGSGSLMNVHGTAGPVTSTADLRAADDRLEGVAVLRRPRRRVLPRPPRLHRPVDRDHRRRHRRVHRVRRRGGRSELHRGSDLLVQSEFVEDLLALRGVLGVVDVALRLEIVECGEPVGGRRWSWRWRSGRSSR